MARDTVPKPSTQQAVSLSLSSTQPPAHLPQAPSSHPLPHLNGSLPNFLTSISHSTFSPSQPGNTPLTVLLHPWVSHQACYLLPSDSLQIWPLLSVPPTPTPADTVGRSRTNSSLLSSNPGLLTSLSILTSLAEQTWTSSISEVVLQSLSEHSPIHLSSQQQCQS